MLWPFFNSFPMSMVCTCMGGGLIAIGFGCLFYDSDSEYWSTSKTWDEINRNYVVTSSLGSVANISFDAFEGFHVYDYTETEDEDDGPIREVKRYGIKANKKDGGRLVVDSDFDTIEEAEKEIVRLRDLTGVDIKSVDKPESPKSIIDNFEEKQAESVYSPAVFIVETGSLSQWSWTLTPKITIFLFILCTCGGVAIVISGNVFLGGESPGYLLLLLLDLFFLGLGVRYLFNNYGRGSKLTLKENSITVEHLWNFNTQKTESLDIKKVKAIVYDRHQLLFFDSRSNDRKAVLSLNLEGLTKIDGLNLESQLGALVAKKTGQDVNEI